VIGLPTTNPPKFRRGIRGGVRQGAVRDKVERLISLN